MALYIAAGLASGLLTTVAGMGGGLLLVVSLLLLLDEPVQALVVSSPALLLGTTHRMWLYRRSVDRTVALGISLGAVPAAFLAGLVVSWVPDQALRALLVVAAAVGLTRGLGLWSLSLGTGWASPVGLVAGVLHGTSGGAGVVLAPYLLARDLVGASYVGTMAVCAVALHVPRLAAFGATGLFDHEAIVAGVTIAASIMVGNLVGRHVVGWLADGLQERLQLGVLVVTAIGAVVGAA